MKLLPPLREAVRAALINRLNIPAMNTHRILVRYGIRFDQPTAPFSSWENLSANEQDVAFQQCVQLIEKGARKNAEYADRARRYLLPYHRAQKIDSLLNE